MSIVMPISMFQTSQLVHAPSGLTTLVQVLSISDETAGVIMDGLSFPSNATWNDTMSKLWKYSWAQVTVSMGSHLIQQLSKNEVWALSYSFSSNITMTATMAGNTADYLNFYGPGVVCSCEVSMPTSITPVVTPTYTNPTSRSCQGDTGDMYLVMMSLTWWDALRYCRHYYTDLFSVPNNRTQRLVAGALGNINGQTAGLWIGLRRHRIWGHLYWTDKEPTDYMNWGADEPDDPLTNMCTAIATDKNFTWNDQCCDLKLNFICY
ncbi:uncharacterized protein [Phyllobates terribilis]|uniref:uncharacterized protein n=1 Tax=Phyllobates terribilis TaxID=111132 RepID=UPI003CCAFFA1